MKQGSGGGVRGEWVAPERGLNDLTWGGSWSPVLLLLLLLLLVLHNAVYV